MGKLNASLNNDEQKSGEAIIEIRAITDVKTWLLKRMGLSIEIIGTVLSIPDDDLKTQVSKLFSFLQNFGSLEDKYHIYCKLIPDSMDSLD